MDKTSSVPPLIRFPLPTNTGKKMEEKEIRVNLNTSSRGRSSTRIDRMGAFTDIQSWGLHFTPVDILFIRVHINLLIYSPIQSLIQSRASFRVHPAVGPSVGPLVHDHDAQVKKCENPLLRFFNCC